MVSLSKFANGGFQNPTLLLTMLGWPLILKMAVSDGLSSDGKVQF